MITHATISQETVSLVGYFIRSKNSEIINENSMKLKVFVLLHYALFLISLSSFPVVFVEGHRLLL